MNGHIVRAYSLAQDGESRPYLSNGQRCANFKVKEFACEDGTDPVFISPTMLDELQAIRTHFNAEVIVKGHSGYRTPQHNNKPSVGGAQFSQHMYGRAADFHVGGVDCYEVAAFYETRNPHSGGLIIYPKENRLHIDDRAVKYRAVQ